ncbi:dynamin family protein [Rutstroemia sp. NJR-2017a WRK4]|nr:dynamin family protein [Rutstroemia sp. NJR-2017a WRK4]
MLSKSFQTDALNGLCSKDQLELLDSIDCLRSQGISHYVSLPQIIMCGDQSSGKSSVLEAISGTSHVGVNVSIVPHESRSEPEKLALGAFNEKLDGFASLPTLIEDAKTAMSISTHGRAFSKDLRRHLTIVDLPGLIHSETKQQSASDVELVQSVVQAYMKEPRSIILAVISAKNDYANQIVLKLARAADMKGARTLGVITKPDTLVAGSESEAMYVSLARNQDVEFRLGWHVEWTLADRDIKELEFFSQGIWGELPRSLLGIDKLRKRLHKVLFQQIATELPSLVWNAAKEFIILTTAHVADAATSKALLQKIFEPALNERMETLKAKTAELLKPHQTSHPITLLPLYHSHIFETAQLTLDGFEQVALKRFVDDIAIEVIEAKLISSLHDIFSPIAESVRSLPDRSVE